MKMCHAILRCTTHDVLVCSDCLLDYFLPDCCSMESLTKEAEDDDQILQNPQPSTSTQVSKNRYD